jgi:uncharacterized OB-fold protein
MKKKGGLHSFVIYHRAFHPAYAAEIPYAVALADLPEGVRMALRVVGCPLEKLRIGAEGEIQFLPLDDTVTIPIFVPLPEKEVQP